MDYARKAIINTKDSVLESYLPGLNDLPLLIQPVDENVDVDITQWSSNNIECMHQRLLEIGTILFRGFEVDTISRHRQASLAMAGGDLAPYVERRSPRTELGDGVYTSTIHPSDQHIHFHNTTSFSHQWPMKLWFCCIKPSVTGGRTPIADTRKVLASLSDETRKKFEETGVMYQRNFYDGMSLSWQDTFQTESKDEVNEFCKNSGIEYKWLDGGKHLQTKQVRHAIATHPITDDLVWFNQGHHFHVKSLEPEVAKFLLGKFSIEELPRHAWFGDGSSITDGVLEEIISAYKTNEESFGWEVGDLLMIDNMLVAHARTPYTGERLISLTLADMFSPSSVKGGVAGP